MRRALPNILAASLVILCAGITRAQFTDDFSDGDFTANPIWSGSNTVFTIDAGQLRSNCPIAASYWLTTPCTLVTNTQREFFVNLKFATSSANYVDVFLTSPASDLSAPGDSYFVRIGDTQDRVALYRSQSGTGIVLLTSPDGVVNSSSNNPFRVRVKCSATGDWTLDYDDGAIGTYTSAGPPVNDIVIVSSSFFGVRVVQSSATTPINNHFFDDFVVGTIPVDVTPPSIVSVTATSATLIDILFSEAVEQTTAETAGNYGIIPFNGAASAARDGINPALVHVTLSLPMQSGNTYTITANGVKDLAGNACVNATANLLYTVADVALPGEVIINEVMADPTPIVGLPDGEFVEILNRTNNKTFDLANWTITAGTTGTLPSITLPPGGYAILTSTTNAALFTGFGAAIGVTSFPTLNNSGDLVSLKNNTSVEIDVITYDLGWYHDNVKAQGGWTIERIDPTSPCSNVNNWTASIATAGGTPDTQNSVFAVVPDNTPPTLINVFVNSAMQIELQFSEVMNAASLVNGSYTITPSIAVTTTTVIAPDRVQLDLGAPLTIGALYNITVSSVSDCPGNTIGSANTLAFALPEAVNSGDVVINEVLYDPISTGSDFVELYNRSNKVLSLANWKLANVYNGSISNATPITTTAQLLLPGEYILITPNSADIASRYPFSYMDRFLQAALPSYNNVYGSVVLEDPNGVLLDRFDYNDNMHFTLLNSTQGVSLERVDPDRPTSDNTNWHSAAEAVGFATPGYKNSEYSATANANGAMTIEPAIFSPDNDGYQDLLTVAYKFDEPGFTGTMKIFDVVGREMKTLIDNQLLGTTGAISWDGIMTTGDLARMGPYVVFFEAFDLQGNVKKFRQTVVLAHRLN